MAMKHGIPTQLVWPGALNFSAESRSPIRLLQDPATRAWNLAVALYHKAGGVPWRLANIDPSVCFIGISFFREKVGKHPGMRTAMAQTFTSSGDGYVLRGRSFEWNQAGAPHLVQESASALLGDVLELYIRQNKGALPSRIVVHKTSKYEDTELAGFREACQLVAQKDFVTIERRGIQFYRFGNYPPLRGTFVKFSDTDLLLYTEGYVPYLKTYAGPRTPQPLEILEHYGDSPWDLILREILALTKMNWNTADFNCSRPITIAFAQRVGEILAELPPDKPMRNEYRFYM